MNKILIMCEGPNEKKIIDILLENGCLKYDNSTKFFMDYFGKNVQLLVDAIKEYQKIRGKTHGKDENCLKELLKDEI